MADHLVSQMTDWRTLLFGEGNRKIVVQKVDNCYSNCFKVFSSDAVRNLSTGVIEK